MLDILNRFAKVLWLGIVVVLMYFLFSVLTMHQCHAEPVVTFGDDSYDCRTMSGYCSDSGSQGNPGSHHIPGYYSPNGVWRAPL